MIWVVATWIYSYVKIYWLYIEKQCTFDNLFCHTFSGFPGDSADTEPACQFRRCSEVGLIPGWGRSPGLGHGNPLQYSCMENSMDREAWWPVVHRVAKSQTQLKRLSTKAHFFNVEKESKNRKKFKTSVGLEQSIPGIQGDQLYLISHTDSDQATFFFRGRE